MKKLIMVLVMIVGICFNTNSYAEYLAPVQLEAKTNDYVGNRLVIRVKNTINDTGYLSTKYSAHDSRLGVTITTMDYNESKPDNATVYSMVITWKKSEGLPLYLSNYVGYCGQNKVGECADDMVVEVLKWYRVVLEKITEAETTSEERPNKVRL